MMECGEQCAAIFGEGQMQMLSADNSATPAQVCKWQ